MTPEPSPAPGDLELRLALGEVDVSSLGGLSVPEGLVAEVVEAARPATRHLRRGQNLVTDVRIGERSGPEQGSVLHLELIAEIPEPYRTQLGEEVDATVELARVGGPLTPVDVIDALGRGIAVLDTKLTLRLGDPVAIRQALHDPDPEIRLMVLDAIAQGRWRVFADDVVPLAQDSQPQVVRAALDCLAVVGGPEHSAQLVRTPRLVNRGDALALYETLGRLGGPPAEGFLRFAAANEEDPALAAAAASSLRGLQDPRGGGAVRDATQGYPDDHSLRGHRP